MVFDKVQTCTSQLQMWAGSLNTILACFHRGHETSKTCRCLHLLPSLRLRFRSVHISGSSTTKLNEWGRGQPGFNLIHKHHGHSNTSTDTQNRLFSPLTKAAPSIGYKIIYSPDFNAFYSYKSTCTHR